ncbi:DUF4859 domain-containing protein [Parapedobacter sp. ISTM3]|uniref:DUF4859 domain-containing protein n=1 Tax=Parapedobacter sp. ISTM3 TaxID=2800130 RepID=UPI0019078E3B|nr:DUF4859 domain-containing protein [Parapedobacter sp. ISTM3]MBK1438698.1 DUF4859 domain-containing protein [Parapedobacter sp. ISTM3]
MMNWKNIWRLCLMPFVLINGCKPDQIGFLNDHLRYNIAEIQVEQGTAVSTNPLIANGSSTPMEVQLLSIRNKTTGAAVPEFLVPQDFHVFLAQVGVDDNTIEQLDVKIGLSTAPPIAVNDIGGKVVFSPATEEVPPGLYTIDLQVSNISGTKVYNEVLDINLIEMKPDSVFASGANTTPIGSESESTPLDVNDYQVSIEHLDNGEDKIIFMWLDRNGEVFNPREGEVVRRASLPSFADWSPFYAEELTDTAIVYAYPYYKGVYYPIKRIARINGAEYTNLASNYRVVGDFTSIGRNVNTATTARFYKPGTHIVRFRLNTIEKTGPRITTITKDVTLPEGAGYAATVVSLDQSELAEALGVDAGNIAGLLGHSLTYYAIEPDGTLNPNSTAAAPGHWFAADGSTISWGDGARLFSELKIGVMEFHIGQFPDRNVAGDTFTLKQALMYDSGAGIAQVIFVFNIKVE